MKQLSLKKSNKSFFFFMCFILFSTFGFSQLTVTKNYTAPGSVTVDGCGSYCTNLPGVTFSTADFTPGACEVTDVNVLIVWAKTDGTCSSPGTGNSFHNETNFRIDGPTGNNVILAVPGTYTGSATISAVTTVLDQAAASVIGGVTPISGTFRPNNGNLNTYNGTSPFGTWTLRAGDTGGGDPLCIAGYSVTVTVTTTDGTAPIPDSAVLPNITAECSLATLVAPTATDACGIITVTNDVTLPITTQGTTVVTWTYDDGNGNLSTQTQNVILTDTIAPLADVASLADVTAECTISVLTAPTATDNCGGLITVTNDATLPITAQGTTVVTWTYDDGNGNLSTQTQNVILTDVTGPTIIATLADVIAECSVTALTAPTPTDNCGGIVTVTNDATLPITAQGTTIVTWTYTDVNSNSSTQPQNVVITDVTGPVADMATLADVTGVCSVTTLTAPTATDNCGGTVTVTNDATLPITAQGTTIITWTYTDAIGNSSTQLQSVILSVGTDASTSLSASGVTITANNGLAGYQWIDCSDNSVIAGEINQSYTASVNGSYAVIVTEGSCSDTSACVTVSTVGIEDLEMKELVLYPNPPHGTLNIIFEGEIKSIEIVDMLGKVINLPVSISKKKVDVSGLPSGKYMTRIITENHRIFSKEFIIQK